MDKTEQVKKWLSETTSYDGCIYIAVDRNGNSFSRTHTSKWVSDRQLVDRMRQLVELWDGQLKANIE